MITKIKVCSYFIFENIIWEVITENTYPSKLIGFSIGPEFLRFFVEIRGDFYGVK